MKVYVYGSFTGITYKGISINANNVEALHKSLVSEFEEVEYCTSALDLKSHRILEDYNPSYLYSMPIHYAGHCITCNYRHYDKLSSSLVSYDNKKFEAMAMRRMLELKTIEEPNINNLKAIEELIYREFLQTRDLVVIFNEKDLAKFKEVPVVLLNNLVTGRVETYLNGNIIRTETPLKELISIVKGE